MSDIKIHDYSQRARRSLAVRTQLEALPPQPVRHDGDHWDFGRRGFAHAYYPGRYGQRTGPIDPIVAAAREAALEAGVDPELVDDIDIEDLIVTPELISGTIGGITFTTRLGEPLSPPQQVPSGLVPAGYSENLTLTTTSGGSTTSATLPGPCIVRSVSWSGVFFTAGSSVLQLPAIGWSLLLIDVSSPLYVSDGNRHELNAYIPARRSAQLVLTTSGLSGGGPFTAAAAVEPLIQKV